MTIETYHAADRYPGNEPGPGSTLFAAPEQYPPTELSPRIAGMPCAFGCGEPSRWMVLGYTCGVTTGTPVCDGHRDAVVAREATWV